MLWSAGNGNLCHFTIAISPSRRVSTWTLDWTHVSDMMSPPHTQEHSVAMWNIWFSKLIQFKETFKVLWAFWFQAEGMSLKSTAADDSIGRSRSQETICKTLWKWHRDRCLPDWVYFSHCRDNLSAPRCDGTAVTQQQRQERLRSQCSSADEHSTAQCMLLSAMLCCAVHATFCTTNNTSWTSATLSVDSSELQYSHLLVSALTAHILNWLLPACNC